MRKLCASTGYFPGQAKPEGYPSELFNRFKVDEQVVAMVLDQLRSEDMCVVAGLLPGHAPRVQVSASPVCH